MHSIDFTGDKMKKKWKEKYLEIPIGADKHTVEIFKLDKFGSRFRVNDEEDVGRLIKTLCKQTYGSDQIYEDYLGKRSFLSLEDKQSEQMMGSDGKMTQQMGKFKKQFMMEGARMFKKYMRETIMEANPKFFGPDGYMNNPDQQMDARPFGKAPLHEGPHIPHGPQHHGRGFGPHHARGGHARGGHAHGPNWQDRLNPENTEGSQSHGPPGREWGFRGPWGGQRARAWGPDRRPGFGMGGRRGMGEKRLFAERSMSDRQSEGANEKNETGDIYMDRIAKIAQLVKMGPNLDERQKLGVMKRFVKVMKLKWEEEHPKPSDKSKNDEQPDIGYAFKHNKETEGKDMDDEWDEFDEFMENFLEQQENTSTLSAPIPDQETAVPKKAVTEMEFNKRDAKKAHSLSGPGRMMKNFMSNKYDKKEFKVPQIRKKVKPESVQDEINQIVVFSKNEQDMKNEKDQIIDELENQINTNSTTNDTNINLNINGSVKLFYQNGDIHWGHVTAGKPNGQGIIYYETGARYEGFFSDGLRHGYGTFISAAGDLEYKGEWKNGTLNGNGILRYQGYIYFGEFVNNHMQGFGKIICHDESAPFASSNDKTMKPFYIGQWHQSKFSGYGQIFYKNGISYKGYFEDSFKSKKGELRFPDGSAYTGFFRMGLPEGQGKISKKDGSFYFGDWSQGMFHGQGKYFLSNVIDYEGAWHQNMREGFGKMYFYRERELYQGNWSNDQRNGYGTHERPDGSCYQGYWTNDKYDGQGQIYYQGKLIKTCQWKDGDIVQTHTKT